MIDEQGQLSRRQLQAAIDDRWPDKAALFQALAEQTKSTAIPRQNLQHITTPAPEYEERSGIGIGSQHVLNLSGEAIQSLAHIARPRRQIDPYPCPGRHHDDAFRADSTRRSAGSLTPASTRTRTPPTRMISISP